MLYSFTTYFAVYLLKSLWLLTNHWQTYYNDFCNDSVWLYFWWRIDEIVIQWQNMKQMKWSGNRVYRNSLIAMMSKLCADKLVVGGSVGSSYERRRRLAANFSSAAPGSHWETSIPVFIEGPCPPPRFRSLNRQWCYQIRNTNWNKGIAQTVNHGKTC